VYYVREKYFSHIFSIFIYVLESVRKKVYTMPKFIIKESKLRAIMSEVF
jgi:hypothetical protein